MGLLPRPAAVRESRRELQRTRAEIARGRDVYMLALAALAIEHGTDVLVATKDNLSAAEQTVKQVAVDIEDATGNLRISVARKAALA